MQFSSLKHVFPRTSKLNSQGHLEIGGVDTLELAEEFGTPLYLFCEESLRQQCRMFIEEFRRLHQQTDVAYAAKAYLGPALAKLLQEEGLGLDVVSGGELAVAEAVDFPAERIYLHGNNKSREELERALTYGVGHIVVDNLHELRILEELAKNQNRQQSILLRVTPGVDAHTHAHTTTGTLDSKFGLPLATGQADEAMRMALASRFLRLRGLHFHLGSPLFQLEPYAAAIEIVLAFAARYREDGLDLQELSPGGGFAIAYTRDQHPPSIAEYAETIVSAIRQGCDSYGFSMPRIAVEPGRAIVGPAGVALYTVGAIKEIPGVRTFASVDGGMGDNIRPALYDAQYEVVAAGRVEEEPTRIVTIAGKYCESGDILVRNANLPSLTPGDLLALPASGAYAPAMASTYNMNPRPAMVMVKDGHSTLIRRRGTTEGMLLDDIW